MKRGKKKKSPKTLAEAIESEKERLRQMNIVPLLELARSLGLDIGKRWKL